jgi:hypothetical protein
MATDIAGLFTTPDQYQLAQQQAQQAQALQYAQLDPRAQAQYGFYRGGQQLGTAIGGALGGVDPQLQLISQRQQLASQLDQSNPESFMKVAQLAAQSGDSQFAMAIADAGRQLQASVATARKTTAEAQKAELTLAQEQQLRDELSTLPPTATESDILGVVTKYGSPDKVLSALQQSADRRTQIESKRDIELQKIEAKKEADLQRAKDEKEREQIRADAKRDAAKTAADARQDIARLAGSLKQPPTPSITQIVDPTNPQQMISIDTRQYKGGGVGSVGVVGISGKEPTAAVRESKVEAGKAELEDQLSTLRNAFTTLNEKRAIPSTERNVASNVLSYIQGSGVGQVAGRMGGTKEQVERDVINSAKQRLVSAIKNATGMSSQQLNSNFELKTMLDSLSDVNLGYEASMRIIDNLENSYVKGAGMGKSSMSAEDKQALQWANSNPNDPRSAQIKQRLGVK